MIKTVIVQILLDLIVLFQYIDVQLKLAQNFSVSCLLGTTPQIYQMPADAMRTWVRVQTICGLRLSPVLNKKQNTVISFIALINHHDSKEYC